MALLGGVTSHDANARALGLVAVLPEILLLVLGFLVMGFDLFMRRQTKRRSLAICRSSGCWSCWS